MYRVGIIGCGSISAVHAQVIQDLEDTTLVACADILPDRAKAMSEQYNCAAYEDYRRMLDEAGLDAVHICTPHCLHPEMVREAADRGIAAFTEKPPAIDREGWDLVKASANRVPVGICFQNRYNPNVLASRKLVESGQYGALRGIRAFVTWNRTREYYAAADWKGRWATEGGGALINQAIHTLDLVIGFLGKPDVAEATMANHRLRGVIEDGVSGILTEDTDEALLEGLVRAFSDEGKKIAQSAPRYAEPFSTETFASKIEATYYTALADARR